MKTRTKYYGSLLRWTRQQCIDWVKSKTCPGCGKKGRFMSGPDYDRFKVHCLECGFRAALKPPEEALA